MIGTHADVVGGLIIAGATQSTGSHIERAHWKPNGIPGTTNVGSNAAGYAIDVTLFAPGTQVWGPWGNGTATLIEGGTSASAPLIAGAAALIFEHSPHLTGREVAQILFESALDIGALGDDVIFGQGFLNVGAALQPLGVTQVTSVTGHSLSLSATAMTVSPAFGDALSPSVAFADGVLMQDKFHRTFNTHFEGQVHSRGLDGFDFDAILKNQRLLQTTALDLGASSLAVSFIDRYAMEKNLAPALPMAAQTQLQHDVPSFVMTGQLTGNIEVAGAVGLSSSGLLDRLTPDANRGHPFMMTRTFQEGSISASTQRSLGVRLQLGDNTSLVGATTYAEHNLDRSRFGPDYQPTAISSQLGISHHLGPVTLHTRAGIIHEEGSVLGSTASGALALGEATTTINTRLEASYRLSSGYIFGVLTGGVSNITAATNSLLSGPSHFKTTSFAFGFVGIDFFKSGDQLGVVMSQPLRVENGYLDAVLPTTGRYAEGTLGYASRRISLTPTGRELNIELNYRWQSSGQQFFASGMVMRQYGHQARLPVGAAALVGWSKTF